MAASSSIPQLENSMDKSLGDCDTGSQDLDTTSMTEHSHNMIPSTPKL